LKSWNMILRTSALFNDGRILTSDSIIWQNGPAGGCHFADFWPLVAEKVHVHRAGIRALTATEVYLDDDETTHFPCDAILCGTGWTGGFYMFDDELRKELGLPYSKDLEDQDSIDHWEKLVAEADEEMLKRFIMLRNPPEHHHIYEQRTPYRLYHVMAPLRDDSILFLNHVVAGAKMFAAEAQAIWAVAYWDKNIRLPSVEERERDIARWIAWNKRRYLSNGELGHFAAFDSVPYVDRLFDEIGLTAHRNKGFLGNIFAPIRPSDTGKVWQEYLAKQAIRVHCNT
jgi:dimethylaniline monooxygenase (N-oxide forming)